MKSILQKAQFVGLALLAWLIEPFKPVSYAVAAASGHPQYSGTFIPEIW